MGSYTSPCCFRTEPNSNRARVLIEITAACNHSCSYCHTADPNQNDGLSLSDYKKIFASSYAANWDGIIISGGEPLLRYDCLDIISAAHDNNLSVDICTNASLIDKATARQLSSLLTEISVTLDGPEHIHDAGRGQGTFQQTLTGINHLVAAGLDVHLLTVVTSHSCKSTTELVRLAADIGAHSIGLLGLMRIGRAQNEDIISYEQELDIIEQARSAAGSRLIVNAKRLGLKPPLPKCPAGQGVLSITASGKLTPCILLSSVQDKHVNEINRADIEQMTNYNQQLTSRPDCVECELQEVCGKGCPAEPYSCRGYLGGDWRCPRLR